jgi:hypothetical protein
VVLATRKVEWEMKGIRSVKKNDGKADRKHINFDNLPPLLEKKLDHDEFFGLIKAVQIVTRSNIGWKSSFRPEVVHVLYKLLSSESKKRNMDEYVLDSLIDPGHEMSFEA